MANSHPLSGKYLNEFWGIGAKHALYREDGKWYHQLKEFPGVLFDANGYVFFETKESYLGSPFLQIQKDLHVINGISSMPNYIRITENNQLQSISQAKKKISERKKVYKTKNKILKAANIPKGNIGVIRMLIKEERVIRDTKVSAWVKHIHDYQCQICGIALQLNDTDLYAEAHHIRPLGEKHNGPDVVENVICVCPNHHALLDYGAIAIDRSMLLNIDGHEINDEYIEYHNNVIYKKKES
jgi:5-methylcytosine-specific restriction protein A